MMTKADHERWRIHRGHCSGPYCCGPDTCRRCSEIGNVKPPRAARDSGGQ